MNRRIQNQIILLLAIIGTAMVAGVIIMQNLKQGRVVSLLETRKNADSVLLNRLVDFKSKGLKDFVFDYTYWDEMVSFIQTGNQKWARENIDISIAAYGAEYAWVFDNQFNPVYSLFPEDSLNSTALLLSRGELEMLASRGKLFNFFIKSSNGIIEVHGGSVHPTNDPQRLTNPMGYYFVGRLWSDGYLAELTEFTGTQLETVEPVKKATPNDFVISKEFKIINYKTLDSWDGYTLVCLKSTGILEIARDFSVQSSKSIWMMVVLLFMGLVLVSFVLVSLINHPLKRLTTSLLTEDSGIIEKLSQQSSEFGYIARLMTEFFNQKRKLVSEIEERVKVENELIKAINRAEESDRLKSAFLNNLSHEIRTPMNAIVGFSELIDDPRITDLERKEFTGIIRESSYRLLSTITDLISLSTLESGQEVVDEEVINLNQTLHSIINEMKPAAVEKGLGLELDVALTDDHCQVLLDKAKLHQILLNLLRNAVKFTKAGKIQFGYTIRTAEIEFVVSDTGIGISPDKFDVIFARFQQADDSISRKFGGSGLGLPISKAYIELLGGRVWLKSEVGKGTQFFFTIPYKPV